MLSLRKFAYLTLIIQRVAFTSLAIAIGGPAFWLWPTAKRIDGASAALLSCRYQDAQGKWRGNAACLTSRIDGISGSLLHAFGAIAKHVPETAAAVEQAAKNSAETSKQSAEAAEQAKLLIENGNGLVSDVRKDIQDLDKTVNDLSQSAAVLIASSNTTVQKAGQSLEELTALEEQLRQAIRDGSPKALQIANAMLALIQDPNIGKSLENFEHASASGAEIFKTVDLATRGLRQKIGRVKWLLEHIIGMIHISPPL